MIKVWQHDKVSMTICRSPMHFLMPLPSISGFKDAQDGQAAKDVCSGRLNHSEQNQLHCEWMRACSVKSLWYYHASFKSADPSRRDMEISYAGSKRCKVILIQTQNPKSKIQTPKSKRRRLGPPQKERRLN